MIGMERKTKILVIDDDPFPADMLRAAFPEQVYEVLSIPDGPSGIEAARAHVPQIVIVDLMLPKLPGLEVVRAIRSHPDTRYVPIMICSAHPGTDNLQRAMQAGANDYYPKPIDLPQFQARVKKLLGH